MAEKLIAQSFAFAGPFDQAGDVANQIARDDPANVELPVLSQAINRARNADPGFSPRPLAGLTQSIARVRVGGVRREWYDTIATLAIPVSARSTISAELERESRAGTVDVRGQLRLDRRFARGVAYIAASVTPAADFREQWGIRAGGELAVWL